MAGDWLSLDHELPETAQVLSIFETTGVEPATIIGRLFLMWRHFDRQTEDGVLPIGLRAIAQIAGGDVDFWQAVADVGWLTLRNGDQPPTAEIPDFGKRFGKTARRRLLDARRAKERRAADKSPTPGRRDDDDPETQQSISISESQSQPQAKPPAESKSRIDQIGVCFEGKPDLAAEVLALARRRFTKPRGPWSRSYIRSQPELRVLLLKLATLLELGAIGEEWVEQPLAALQHRGADAKPIDDLPGWIVSLVEEAAQKVNRTVHPLIAAVKLPRDLLGAAAGDGPANNPRT